MEVSAIDAEGAVSYIAVAEDGSLTRTTGTVAASAALSWKVQKTTIESFIPTPEQKPWADSTYRESAF